MAKDDLLSSLRKLDLLSRFSPSALEKLATITREQTLPAQSTIFREGDPGDALYILKKGKVTVSKSNKNGLEVVIATLTDGAVLGDMALIDDQPRSATVTTVQPTAFYIIQDTDFKSLLYSNSEITSGTMRILCERLRKANEKLVDFALDNHPDMVILTDPDFRITDINKQAQKLLRIRAGEHLPPPLEGKLRVLLEKVAERAHDRKPFFWVLLKPERLFLWIHVNPLKGDEGFHKGYLVELRDITQVRDTSRRSLEIASFIIHRLPDLAEQVSALVKSLDETQPVVRKAFQTAHALTRQVNKLVAFTELEAGPLRLMREAVNPDRLVAQAINSLQTMMAGKGNVMECRLNYGEGENHLDREWFGKLISILLSNAIDYSPPETPIVVQTTRTPAGRFRCRIQNHCEHTFTEENICRLFDVRGQLEDFENLNSLDFGLELPLARHIIDSHNGVITIEPDLENLFSVVFEIP